MAGQEARVKTFMPVELEGASGITGPEDVLPGGTGYRRGRVS
jgi:D-aminopeptidase